MNMKYTFKIEEVDHGYASVVTFEQALTKDQYENLEYDLERMYESEYAINVNKCYDVDGNVDYTRIELMFNGEEDEACYDDAFVYGETKEALRCIEWDKL